MALARASEARKEWELSEVTLTIVRPYQTVEEFLDNDAWTAGRTDLLLIDQAPVPMKTIVHFRVALDSGETLFQGEGWAAGHVKPLGGRPGGLRVRFRKIDAPSKAMLQRALEALEKAQEAEPIETITPPQRGNSAPPKMNEVALPPNKVPEIVPGDAPPSGDCSDQSGLRYVVRNPIKAPENRDELLDRLRKRPRVDKAG